MLFSVHAQCALSTMMAAVSIADLLFLLPNCLSLNTALLSTSLESSSATTFSATLLMELSTEIIQYDVSFV